MSLLEAIFPVLRTSDAVVHGSQRLSAESAAELWGGGPMTRSAAQITEETAQNLSAVYRAISLYGNALAILPAFLHRRLDGGRVKQRETKHIVYRLIHTQPNPYCDPGQFFSLIGSWLAGWNNACAEVERDGRGDPVNLWPIHPGRCRGFMQGGVKKLKVWNDNGTVTILEPGDYLHVQNGGTDVVWAKSPIHRARQSLGMTQAAEEMGATFFENDATMRYAVQVPASLGPDERDRVRKSWQEAQTGMNRWKTPLIGGEIKIHPISIPNEDAQFLETRKFQIVEIARWFNVPPHMLYDLERATFSNIEHLGIEFVTFSILPLLVRIEQALDRVLLKPEEREQEELYTEFLLDALLRADSLTRAQVNQIKAQNGALCANEWRNSDNQNAIEGGDVYLVNGAMVPLAKYAALARLLAPDPEHVEKADHRRKSLQAFIADGTVGDAVANLTLIKQLAAETGLPTNPDYEEPYVPVRDDAGQPVTGEVVRDSDDAIVGGASAEEVPVTTVTTKQPAGVMKAGTKAPAAPATGNAKVAPGGSQEPAKPPAKPDDRQVDQDHQEQNGAASGGHDGLSVDHVIALAGPVLSEAIGRALKVEFSEAARVFKKSGASGTAEMILCGQNQRRVEEIVRPGVALVCQLIGITGERSVEAHLTQVSCVHVTGREQTIIERLQAGGGEYTESERQAAATAEAAIHIKRICGGTGHAS